MELRVFDVFGADADSPSRALGAMTNRRIATFNQICRDLDLGNALMRPGYTTSHTNSQTEQSRLAVRQRSTS